LRDLPIGWENQELTESRSIPHLSYIAAIYSLVIADWVKWMPELQATVEGSNTPSVILAYLYIGSEV
jgi:hypothetical protein